jgi:hypothetical protein
MEAQVVTQTINVVPVQTVATIFAVLLTIISGLLLWGLTKLQNDITKVDTKADKKVSIEMLEEKVGALSKQITDLTTLITSTVATKSDVNGLATNKELDLVKEKVNAIAVDVSFMKGKLSTIKEVITN